MAQIIHSEAHAPANKFSLLPLIQLVNHMNMKYRLISPDKKQRSKPLNANDIHSAVNQGRIGLDWIVQDVESGVTVALQEFALSQVDVVESKVSNSRDKKVSKMSRRTHRRNTPILYVVFAITFVCIGVLFALFVIPSNHARSTQPPAQKIEVVPVAPLERPIEKRNGRPDGKLVADVVTKLLRKGSVVQLKNENEKAICLELVNSDCQISIEYEDQFVITVHVEISSDSLSFEGKNSSVDRTIHFMDAAYTAFVLVNNRTNNDLQHSQSLLRWIDYSHPYAMRGRLQARMFGSTLVQLRTQDNKTVVIFNVKPSAESIEQARWIAKVRRDEATENAEAIENWTEMQFALRGVDGFDIMPTINAELIGSISIGDSMLQVAETLSIQGTEMVNLQGISQVQWKDDQGQIILTFEGGKVSGKIGL